MKRGMIFALILFCVFLSGCMFDTILSDVVNRAPRAVIDATPQRGAAPLTVSFDAQYSHDDDGDIVEYRWSFGDRSGSGSQDGSTNQHTYAHPGTYLVKLTVIDNEGATDSQQIAVVVTNPPPVAQASVSNDSPFPSDEVTFDASASYDFNGSVVGCAWDFGDGATAIGITARHTYIEGGYYVVTLTVTDDEGATATTRFGMNVLPGHSNCGGGSTCGSSPIPHAVITGLPSSCSGVRVGEPIRLDGTASRAGVGEIVSYHWDFGDGTTAAGPIVTHAYTKAWTYPVVLTVIDEAGGVGIAEGYCSIQASTPVCN
jgi:PKD repeat protein